MADRPPEDEGDRDGIVGVAEDGDEVRDEIDRQREVDEQAAEHPACSPRCPRVRRQAFDQAQHVGDEADDLLPVDRPTHAARLDPEDGDEGDPEEEQTGDDREDDDEPVGHGALQFSRTGSEGDCRPESASG